MKTVNPYFLDTLIEPLAGLGDDDESVLSFRGLDSNDESQMRSIIRKMIVPHALSLSTEARERVKLAYQFYLSKPNGVSFLRLFDSNLPPFNAPDDPRLFFVWIWEECFPGEELQLANIDEYRENPDINEPLEV